MRIHKLRNHIHIAVIGGNGFLGRSIITRFFSYPNVRIYSLDRREHGIFIDTENSKAIIEQISIDVNNQGALQSWLTASNVDVVIYAAGYENPPSGVWNNSAEDIKAIVGLNYVLNSLNSICLDKNAEKPYFLYVSSWAVYGVENFTQPLTEDAKEFPGNHVGMARLLGEDLVKRLCTKYSVPFCIVRPTEVYGKHHRKELDKPSYWPGYLAYYLDRILYKDKELQIWNGESKVDLVHVNYFSKTILHLIENRIEGTYNISSGQTISCYDLAKKLLTLDEFNNSKTQILPADSPLDTESMTIAADKIHSLVPYDKEKYDLDTFIKAYLPIRRFELAQNLAIEDILSEPLTVDTTATGAKTAYEARKQRRRLAYLRIKEIAGPEFFQIKLGRIQERTKELLTTEPTKEEIELAQKTQEEFIKNKVILEEIIPPKKLKTKKAKGKKKVK